MAKPYRGKLYDGTDADNRPNGFYRGLTFPGVTISPSGSGSISLPVSVVGEDPQEGMPTNWGRIAHEIGHEIRQENIDYFDATGAGDSPGAPGSANKDVIHLRNDSPSQPKSFTLGVLRSTLPAGWDVIINGGQNLVQLAPGAEEDVPVSIKQNIAEPIGSSHQVRIIASSRVRSSER